MDEAPLDAHEGILTVLPLTAAGVCFFRVDDLALASAVRLGVRRIPVDRRERRRVINELRERSQRVPMTGGSWEDFFGFWPPYLPIILTSSWRRAPLPGSNGRHLLTGVSWICIIQSGGYLGTTELPFDGFPLGFDDAVHMSSLWSHRCESPQMNRSMGCSAGVQPTRSTDWKERNSEYPTTTRSILGDEPCRRLRDVWKGKWLRW